MEEKQKFLLETQIYLKETEKEIKDLLEAFKWTENDTLKEKSIQSKINKTEKLDDRLDMLPESTFPKDSNMTVTFDRNLQYKVILEAFANDDNFQLGRPIDSLVERDIPQTSEDIFVNFTLDERLAMYNYVIEQTRKQSEPESSSFLDNIQEKQLKPQISDIMKPLKHTSAKRRICRNKCWTFTEEIRELIATQMNTIVFEPNTDCCDNDRVKSQISNISLQSSSNIEEQSSHERIKLVSKVKSKHKSKEKKSKKSINIKSLVRLKKIINIRKKVALDLQKFDKT